MIQGEKKNKGQALHPFDGKYCASIFSSIINSSFFNHA
jgi:hypothetical protein